MSINGQSLPPGPPYGDGTPFGYGDAYGNGFGNSYAYGVAGIGYGGGYGSSSYISSLGGIVSVTPTKTDPKRQYIAARPGQAYTPDIAVTLSAEWDEMLGQSSAVLSRRMLLDPQVRSAWNYFKFSVLADGPILSPAVTPEEGRELTPEEQAECDLAKEITDYCLRQQERIERPIDEVLGQLFDGCIHRGAIVEKVEEPIEDGPDKGKRGLKALVTLPSTAWAFVTDLYGKNVGVAGWTADGPKVLDPRHFAIFTWEPKAGDPRGTNILDAAFSAWNEKVSLVPERFRHLVLFGSPSTVYELPEGAQPQAQLDQNGNPDYTRAPIDPIYQGMQQLSAFRGGGQMVHSHGGKVSLIDAANDGGAFTAAKMDCNREIATAILLTPGSTMEAQHDSNANAQTKQDATGILIRRAQARLASVYRGLLKELITPNWGNDVAARLTPKVAFAVEHHDQAATIGTWSQAGWAPDPVQFQEIDSKVGLRTPRPDQAVADDAVEDDQDEKEEEDAVFSVGKGKPRKKKGKSAESASLGHIESGTHSGHGGNPNHGVDGKFIDGPRMKPETPPPPGPHTADKVQDHLSTILSEAVEYIPGSKMLKGLPRKPRMERMVGRIKEFLGGVDHSTLKQVARMNEVGTKDPLNSLTREYIRIFKSQAGFSDAKVEEEATFAARKGESRKKKGKSADSAKTASVGHLESGTHSGHGGNPNHGADGKFAPGGGGGSAKGQPKTRLKTGKTEATPPPAVTKAKTTGKLATKSVNHSGGKGGFGSHVVKEHKPISGEKVSRSRDRFADEAERQTADAIGAKWKTGNEPSDAHIPKQGGQHQIEIKSKSFGDKQYLSVHPNALYLKARDAEAHPGDTWHTVAIDARHDSEGGAHRGSYSGHDLYYKRAAGPYALSKMHKVKDIAELHKLIAMPDHELPTAARGEFLKGKALADFKAKADQDREYNNNRSKERKARLGKAAYGKD